MMNVSVLSGVVLLVWISIGMLWLIFLIFSNKVGSCFCVIVFLLKVIVLLGLMLIMIVFWNLFLFVVFIFGSVMFNVCVVVNCIVMNENNMSIMSMLISGINGSLGWWWCLEWRFMSVVVVCCLWFWFWFCCSGRGCVLVRCWVVLFDCWCDVGYSCYLWVLWVWLLSLLMLLIVYSLCFLWILLDWVFVFLGFLY